MKRFVSSPNQHINEIEEIIKEYNDCFECDFYSSYSIILRDAISNKKKKCSFSQQIKDLLQYPKDNDFSKLEQLVGYLFLQEERSQNVNSELSDKLKTWLDKYSRTEDLVEFVKRTYLEKEVNDNFLTVLLIQISQQTNTYLVRAWLIEDLDSYTNKPDFRLERIEKNFQISALTQDKITEITKKILNQAYGVIDESNWRTGKITRICVCVPSLSILQKDIKICALDYWLIHEEKRRRKIRIGQDHQIVLSLLEYRENLGNKERVFWKRRSTKLNKILSEVAMDIIHELDHKHDEFDEQLEKKEEGEEVLALRLEKALIESEDESVEMFELCMEMGIPFIIWTRKNINPATNNSKQALNNLCQGIKMEDLPEAIRCSRKEGYKDPDSLGSHLSLLWDDHELSIPNIQKKLPKS